MKPTFRFLILSTPFCELTERSVDMINNKLPDIGIEFVDISKEENKEYLPILKASGLVKTPHIFVQTAQEAFFVGGFSDLKLLLENGRMRI